MNMKYKLTPFNIVSIGIIIVSIWSAIYSGPEGWGVLVTLFLLPIGILGLFIDYLIRSEITKYKRVLIIETLVLLLIAFCYSLTEKSKTLIIPDKLTSNYIVTIYGVKNAPKLPINIWTWNYEIKIPKNGILLTSSTFENDLPETKMKTYSGIELNTNKTELGFIRLMDDEIDCNGQKYKYRSWMIDSLSCCLYSTKDLDLLKQKIEYYYCKQKPSL
jgi:hypothetical protein